MMIDTEFYKEALHGLSLPQKKLSPKWLYDAHGSDLFEQITSVPEYYPTRTEAGIFKTAFPAIGAHIPQGGAIVEYGSGSSRKTVALLNALKPSLYVPLDISEAFLLQSAEWLRAQTTGVTITPVVGDFLAPASFPATFYDAPHRLGFFPGSTLGNLPPEQAEAFLRNARTSLGAGAAFLIGVDLVKDRGVLEAAYDDAGGVTAEFNLNLLTRMNRELGTNFDPKAFRHRALFNIEQSRIEMHLVSNTAQTVRLGDHDIHFEADETIHTESSYKFTRDSLSHLANAAGWSMETVWTDPKEWFAVALLRDQSRSI